MFSANFIYRQTRPLFMMTSATISICFFKCLFCCWLGKQQMCWFAFCICFLFRGLVQVWINLLAVFFVLLWKIKLFLKEKKFEDFSFFRLLNIKLENVFLLVFECWNRIPLGDCGVDIGGTFCCCQENIWMGKVVLLFNEKFANKKKRFFLKKIVEAMLNELWKSFCCYFETNLSFFYFRE